jgi:hypothetical protein
MIETPMAASTLAIGSLGMMGLVVGSIATNNPNKIDSTPTLLAEAILEQLGRSMTARISLITGKSGAYRAPLQGRCFRLKNEN